MLAYGVRNSDRYFEPMNFEKEQMLQQQQQRLPCSSRRLRGNKQTSAQMLMQTEGMKAQTRAQVDLARAQLDNQYKMHKLAMDDDLVRDEMVQDLKGMAEILESIIQALMSKTLKLNKMLRESIRMMV